MKVYLDNAATTKMDTEVVALMHSIMQEYYGNPSSIYEYGRQARVIIENARSSIAQLLKVRPAEIFFTSGGTESINTIVNGALKHDDISTIITSRIEHSAMLSSLNYYGKLYNKAIHYLAVDEEGHIDIDELEEDLSMAKGKCLVSLMHANNELGTLLPLKKVSEHCRKHKAWFLSDTVQTMGKFRNNLSSGILDFAIGSAHKFHGPKGVGFMYINGENKIHPLLMGGSQERNMRAGTENIAGIAGMAKAMEIAYANMENTTAQITQLKHYLIETIRKEMPYISFNGDIEGLPHLLNMGIAKTKHNELILMQFDIHGIFVSGGSACSSGALKDSPVIAAIGKAEKIRPIRLAMSKYTTKEELDYFIEVLKNL